MTAIPIDREDGLTVIPRDDFCRDYFHYKAGDHVVFGGPTTRGKTTLAFDLLEYCASPELPAYVAVSKPRDPTTEKMSTALGYVRVSDWPAPRKLSNWNPSGYVIWPKFGDMEGDPARASAITSRLLRDRYAAGARSKKGILVLDDTMVKAKVLGLDREMTTLLAMSGAMGIGVWIFVQKPTDSGSTPIWSFSQSEHVFMTRDSDARNRLRYNEIAGIDGQFVSRVTKKLQPFQFLYIKKTEEYMCIVDKD